MNPRKTVTRLVGGRMIAPHPLPPKMLYLMWYVSTLGLTNKLLFTDDRPKGDTLSTTVARRNNTSFNPMMHDGKFVWEEHTLNASPVSFTKYNTELEISRFLDHISASHPDIVTVFPIGKSVEGREIRAVRISTGGHGMRPAILLDGGIHAREWISPAVVLYVLNELAANPKRHSQLLDKIDWYFVPLLNPDGYIYSMSRIRIFCLGRQSSFGMGVGNPLILENEFAAQNYDPCSPIYRGPGPFSEPESKALRDFVMANRMQIKVYLSFHSFGNYILYPWGHRGAKPSDWQSLERLAIAASKAISRNSGAKYRVGSSSAMLGSAAGGSTDWVKGYAGIQYAYTLELPGGGRWGFDLPEKDITKVCSDIFEAVKIFADFIGNEETTKKTTLRKTSQISSRRMRVNKYPKKFYTF